MNAHLTTLGKEKAMEFFRLYHVYNTAPDSKRSPRLMDLLLFTFKHLGKDATRLVLEKETLNAPLARFVLLAAVERHASKT